MNSLSRYYLAPEEWQTDLLMIKGDEAHHAVRVLRAKIGDKVQVFDGVGKVAVVEIIKLSKSEVVTTIIDQKQSSMPVVELELCQAVPKGGNMEWIVQKAVELGISRIQPFITQNTIVRPEHLEKKRIKWQRTALEACKQCGQNFLPYVAPPVSLNQWLKSREAVDLEVVAALDPRAVSLKVCMKGIVEKTKKVRVLIGPEGDFSDQEYQGLHESGMQLASIGEVVMKVETAAFYCISILQHELNT